MSENTNNLQLPYLMAAQAQKHVTHNEALRLLDDIVQIGVTSRSVLSPPSGPSEGQRFIVPENAMGVWANHTHSLSGFQDGAWQFHTPREGWLCWVEDEQVLLVFTQASWVLAKAEAERANVLGINTQADATNRLSVKSDAVLLSHDDQSVPANGDVRLKLNKSVAADTASLLFQTGYSGRAEMGLAGSDGFAIKVSADGATWSDALSVDPSTGAVSFPNTQSANNALPAGGVNGQVVGKLSAVSNDVGWVDIPTTASIDAGTIHLYEQELGSLPKRCIAPDYIDGSVVQGLDWRWTAQVGADFWFLSELDSGTLANGSAFVELRVDEGAFSQAYVEQLDGTSVIANSRHDLVAERDRLISRDILLLPNATTLRVRFQNIGTSQAVTFAAPGIGFGEPATSIRDSKLAASIGLSTDEPNAAQNLFSIDAVTSILGSTPVVQQDFIKLVSGSVAQFNVPLPNKFELGDEYSLLLRISKPVKSLSFTMSSANPGGAGSEKNPIDLGNGWICIEGVVNTGDGGEVAFGTLTIDNSDSAELPAGDVKANGMWLVRNTVGLPSQIKLPGVVAKHLSDLGLSKLYVATNGDDNNSGSEYQPLQTVAEALHRGASRIALDRNGIHRSQQISIDRSVKFSAFGEADGPSNLAKLFFSEKYEIAELQTTSNPDVFFVPMPDNPGGLWQTDEGEFIRLGIVAANGKGFMAIDEATVVANAGSWWHGEGSTGTGLYIHPREDYSPQTSFEIPKSTFGLIIQSAEKVEFDQIELVGAGMSNLEISSSSVTAKNCRFAHSGSGDCVRLGSNGLVSWHDEDCRFEDAGQNGIATMGPVKITSQGSNFVGCLQHGFASEANDFRGNFQRCAFDYNGGKGYSSSVQGEYRFEDCFSYENYEEAISVVPSDATKTTAVTMVRCISDQTVLSSETPEQLSASIYDHDGLLDLKGDVSISGFKASGDDDLLTVQGGETLLENAHLTRGTRAIKMIGGALALKSTNLTHSGVGVQIFGGAIELDPDGTVNLFGNGEDFVNAPETQIQRAVSYPTV